MVPSLDPDQYTTVPTRTPRSSLSLARALISAAPSRPGQAVAKRLAWLREQAERLQLAWIDANRPTSAQSVRPLDLVLDRRWGALRSRLEGCVQIGDDESSRAQQLVELLFPTGLGFLALPYAEQWAESERRLVGLARDERVDELVALVGDKFVASLRQAHADYGRALGITKARDDAPEAVRVLEPLRQLHAAIQSYARGVIGNVDERDEGSVKAAIKQLEPILRARRAASGGGESTDVEEPIDQPLPELPTAEPEAAAVA